VEKLCGDLNHLLIPFLILDHNGVALLVLKKFTESSFDAS
jgi:hypothetical protein